MKVKLFFKTSLVLLACCSLISCFGNSRPRPLTRAELAKQRPLSNPTTDVSVEPFSSELTPGEPKLPEFGVELTWEIPEEPVEAFVLYTGSTPEVLNTEIHLTVSNLQVVEGKRYRYVIKPVASDTPLYVALAAKYEGQVSNRSPVQKINPEAVTEETKPVTPEVSNPNEVKIVSPPSDSELEKLKRALQ